MNINSFIQKFGKYTFEKRPFDDVDAIILAELSMISFETLLDKKGEICLKNIKISQLTPDIFYDSPDRSFNKKQLIEMTKSHRYKNIVVKNVKRIFSEENYNQFYAITIVLPNGDLYLSFRGTDITLVGWREDFIMAQQDFYLGQHQAYDYTQEVISNCDSRFYLGGHSKGGNLAFYVALQLNEKEAERLIYSYSFDGPGLRVPMKEFPGYQFVSDKMIKYRTFNNLIGAVFNQMKNYKVIHSTGLLLGGHDLYYWQINPKTGDFNYAKDVSFLSKRYTNRLMSWINSLPDSEKETATDAFFEIFKNCKTIYDLPTKAPIALLNMKNVVNSYPKEDQEMLQRNLKKLVEYLVRFDKIGN